MIGNFGFAQWLANTSMVTLVIFLFASMALVAIGSAVLRRFVRRQWPRDGEAEGGGDQSSLLISSVLGLLALLLAFTFSLAISRYEERRELVIAEANAIGTSYLRAQLLEEPHRGRLSSLLIAYTDNRIALGTGNGDRAARLATNDRLLTNIWAAVAAARESAAARNMLIPLANTINELIDLDTERKVARQARVPAAILLALLVYLLVTAAVVGIVVEGRRARLAAAILFLLLTLSVGMIADLSRPGSGLIRESQEPMMMLRASLAAQPPPVFDRYRDR